MKYFETGESVELQSRFEALNRTGVARSAAVLATAVLFCCPSLLAQADITRPADQSGDGFKNLQEPHYLTGKVAMEDGSPPPVLVVIEAVCNGVARQVATTDAKGRFSFDLEGIKTCEIRAQLGGYMSESIDLVSNLRRVLDHPDVGILKLRKLGTGEGSTISMSARDAPKDARKAFEKGLELIHKEKSQEARNEFKKAVEIYPNYATAWYELGRLQAAGQDRDEARKSFAKAMAADPKYTSPCMPLLELAVRESQWREAADVAGRLIALEPRNLQAYYYDAVARYSLREFDAAEKSGREALKLDTQHRFPRIEPVLAAILMEKHDLAGAAECLRDYLKFAPKADNTGRAREQLAQLEKMIAAQKPRAQP